jgi:hypothetical protein
MGTIDLHTRAAGARLPAPLVSGTFNPHPAPGEQTSANLHGCFARAAVRMWRN